ncbi:MAG: NnrU family protein [Proteobacteria bacterium]|nr:NnrU family protein [Pseudomonadota bacterium]
MTTFVLGLVLFFGIHLVQVLAPGLRARGVAAIGLLPWKGLYALLSIAGVVLIVQGFPPARAAYPPLYVTPAWLHLMAVVLLVPVFPMVLAAYLPGRIQSVLKHPMLAATKLWAFAHLLANGRPADLALFGAFLAWAVVLRISMKRRPPAPPVPGLPPGRWNDAIAVGFGLALYAAFVAALHLRLFGVAPLG